MELRNIQAAEPTRIFRIAEHVRDPAFEILRMCSHPPLSFGFSAIDGYVMDAGRGPTDFHTSTIFYGIVVNDEEERKRR